MAHGEVYVAQTTPAHLNHFYRAIMEANDYPGPAVVIAYSPCMPEHGIADDAATRQAKLAVESRAFPLFTYDPRRGATYAERLSLQGNPALRDDWATAPDGSVTDFLAFARTEGRFAPHFGQDGAPTPEIVRPGTTGSPTGGRCRSWRGSSQQPEALERSSTKRFEAPPRTFEAAPHCICSELSGLAARPLRGPVGWPRGAGRRSAARSATSRDADPSTPPSSARGRAWSGRPACPGGRRGCSR